MEVQISKRQFHEVIKAIHEPITPDFITLEAEPLATPLTMKTNNKVTVPAWFAPTVAMLSFLFGFYLSLILR